MNLKKFFSIKKYNINYLIKLNFYKNKYYNHILQISKFKNSHIGERCFIIGNGPSLKPEDLDKLENEITFSSNRIYNIFDQTKWRPYYYCVSDNGIMHDYFNEIYNLKAKNKFLNLNYFALFANKINFFKNISYFVQLNPSSKSYLSPDFSTELTKGISTGATVTYICIQLAAYMGFSEIYLIGIDHNYPKIIDKEGNVIDTGMISGYCFNETDERLKNQVVNINYSTAAFKKAKEYCENNNIKIFNATRGGNLDVFKRVDFDILI